MKISYHTAIAYACVAYRMMESEGGEISEEYLEIFLEILYEFCTPSEIQKIYQNDIKLSASEVILSQTE